MPSGEAGYYRHMAERARRLADAVGRDDEVIERLRRYAEECEAMARALDLPPSLPIPDLARPPSSDPLMALRPPPADVDPGDDPDR